MKMSKCFAGIALTAMTIAPGCRKVQTAAPAAAVTAQAAPRTTAATIQEFDAYCDTVAVKWLQRENQFTIDEGFTGEKVKVAILSTDLQRTESILHPIVGVLSLEEITIDPSFVMRNIYTLTFAPDGKKWIWISGHSHSHSTLNPNADKTEELKYDWIANRL